jgi:hypothetical protein
MYKPVLKFYFFMKFYFKKKPKLDLQCIRYKIKGTCWLEIPLWIVGGVNLALQCCGLFFPHFFRIFSSFPLFMFFRQRTLFEHAQLYRRIYAIFVNKPILFCAIIHKYLRAENLTLDKFKISIYVIEIKKSLPFRFYNKVIAECLIWRVFSHRQLSWLWVWSAKLL